MTVEVGGRVGPYEILAPLGAGGMGEVYRARDTRLDRDVAIKVIGAQMAGTPESRERFEREARAISKLNHPNICTLHDVGHQSGLSYLVLEYLEGETLAARIARGALSPPEALQIAIAICEALDTAHRQGIVHRDLKPGNVMLVKPGASKTSATQGSRAATQVKLLDFGLAKAVSRAPAAIGATPNAAIDLSMPVTQTTPLTLQGTILGTFQYMSPDVLEGADADERADIWAFGCVLYEMLTGRKTFDGRTQASLLSAILATEPTPLASLQPLTPPALEHTVLMCLAKDPDERFQSAHDVLLQLRWVAAAGSQTTVVPPATARARRGAYGRTAAAVAAAVALTAIGVWTYAAPRAVAPLVVRAALTLPPGVEFNVFGATNLAVSPDGSRIVFGGFTADTPKLFMRETGNAMGVPMSGTEGAVGPFFSPDGAWVGFFNGGRLWKVAVAGGPPIAIAAAPAVWGAAWLPDNTIVFPGLAAQGLLRVSADGGTPQSFTKPQPGDGVHRWPSALPDGSVLYASAAGGGWSDARIFVQQLDGRPRTVLSVTGSSPRFVASGHLLVAQNGSVFAVPFDPGSLTATGSRQRVIESVAMNETDGRAQFAVSSAGVAVSVGGVAGVELRRLAWVSFDGKVTPLPLPERGYEHPRVSPDGSMVAVTVRDTQSDVWVIDVARGAMMRLTTEAGEDESPVWTSDSKRVTFASSREGTRHTVWKTADGSASEEVLSTLDNHQHLAGWTPDGQRLLMEEGVPTGWSLVVDEPKANKRTPFLASNFSRVAAHLSPDGRWVAYASNESSRSEIYVSGFAGQSGRTQISTEGGTEPRWAHDGRTLYFRNGDRMMAVPVRVAGSVIAGAPRVLFEGSFARMGWLQANYDVAPGGRGFLMVRGDAQRLPTAVDIVSNWFEELRRSAPK